jgi:hypothetical protein
MDRSGGELMRPRLAFLPCIAVAVAFAVPAAAQTRSSQESFRLVIDGGATINPQSFGQDFTLTKNVESTPVTIDMKPAAGGFIEAGGRVRVGRSLWLGAVGFASSGSADGTLTAEVPHPFYFNRRREISGDLTGLSHSESGAHVEVAYAIQTRISPEIQIFGGPSYFKVKQTLVTDFTFTDSYPYDTARFGSATTTEASSGAWGFNVGGEVTWRLGRSLLVGGLVRYSLANVTLSPSLGNDVDLQAGGIDLGAAVRVAF